MDIGGTITGRNRYDPMDAYTEVGGRATQDAKAEGIESQAGSGDREQRKTTTWMWEVEYCLDTHKDVSGRVASGTKTEQISSNYRATLSM